MIKIAKTNSKIIADPITIMQVLPALNSGGVERGAVDVANFIISQGHKSIIISAGGRMQMFLNRSVKHIKLNVNSKNPFVIFLNIYRIRKIILEHQVDILHVRSRAPAWSCFYAIRKTKCKMLTTFHGTYSMAGKLKKKYNEIMLKGSKVIAVSKFIKNHIKQNYPELFDNKLIEVIHRGVDINIFNPEKISCQSKVNLINLWNVPDDKKIILLPGRITQWKGHEFLIEALKLLKRDDYICLFVGDFDLKNNYKNKLGKQIVAAGLEGKIKFVGVSTNMPIVYSICDIVISASILPEAFGRIAIEAQAMGKIVIATKIGGSKETIIDNKTGFLVEPGNAKDLAQKISQALNAQDDVRQKLAKAGRENVIANFSNDLMLKKTLKIYQDLLRRK